MGLLAPHTVPQILPAQQVQGCMMEMGDQIGEFSPLAYYDVHFSKKEDDKLNCSILYCSFMIHEKF